MRITYTKKSKDVREKALKQLRELRAKFENEHPDLLNRIKNEVKKQPLYDEKIRAKAAETDEHGNLIIDKKKNLMTVATLVQSQSGSEHFQKELRKILLDVAESSKH